MDTRPASAPRLAAPPALLLAVYLVISLALLTSLLTGCTGESEEIPYRTYLERLGRTLDIEPPAVRPSEIPLPPRVGKLRQPLPSDSLDTLDFLALTGCEVQVTIGKRNSSLGRLAAPSQRLLLELEYLRLAPACIAHLHQTDRTELANTLDKALQLKREQLPALIFNATLGGPEYRAFWRGQATPGAYPAVDSGTAAQALSNIDQLTRQWLGGDYRADNEGFEILLSEVAGGGGGRLHRELDLQARWLAAADAALAQRMAQGPLCGTQLRHPAADILPVVVRRFFVEGIQAESAKMNGRQYQLLPPVADLETQLAGVLPDNYRQWMQARQASLDWSNAAPRRHVELLNEIQSPCGTSPAADP